MRLFETGVRCRVNGWCTEERLGKETSKHAHSYISPPFTHTHTPLHISKRVTGVLDYKAGNIVTV